MAKRYVRYGPEGSLINTHAPIRKDQSERCNATVGASWGSRWPCAFSQLCERWRRVHFVDAYDPG